MTQSIPSAAGRTAAAHKAKADVLVVGLNAEGTVLAEDLKPALAKDLEKAAVSVDASGRLDTTARVPAPRWIRGRFCRPGRTWGILYG